MRRTAEEFINEWGYYIELEIGIFPFKNLRQAQIYIINNPPKKGEVINIFRKNDGRLAMTAKWSETLQKTAFLIKDI